MFSSPAVNVFSRENTEVIARKPGVTSTIPRKPFNDRGVNGSSPVHVKSEPFMKKAEPKTENFLSPLNLKDEENDDLFIYDRYTYKEFEDNYSDIQHLSPKDVLNIVRSYCHYDEEWRTSPLELADDVNKFIISDTNFDCGEDFEDVKFQEESIDDVSLPEVDFN